MKRKQDKVPGHCTTPANGSHHWAPQAGTGKKCANPIENLLALPEHMARLARSTFLKMRQPSRLEPLNVYTKRNGKKLQYVWDGLTLRLVPPEEIDCKMKPNAKLCGKAAHVMAQLKNSFYPSVESVTNDYWEYMKWGHYERFWATSMKLLGTQSLLMALGIGARKSITASAALNWMMRDGLGKITRTVVATRFGNSFDSNLKRSRFQAAFFFTAAVGLELMCPAFPKQFLILASLANVGHAIALTIYTSTSPVLAANFSKDSTIGVFTAKRQARRMVVDSAALGMIASFIHIFRETPKALSLAAYPVCTFMMIVCTYNQLRALELRTLNSERLRILSQRWVRDREVLSPFMVSQLEGFWGDASRLQKNDISISFGDLEHVASSPFEISQLIQSHKEDRYIVSVRDSPKPRIKVSLRQDALPCDVLAAFLHVAHAKDMLQSSQCLYSVGDTRNFVQRNLKSFVKDLGSCGWVTDKYWFSAQEQHGYIY